MRSGHGHDVPFLYLTLRHEVADARLCEHSRRLVGVVARLAVKKACRGAHGPHGTFSFLAQGPLQQLRVAQHLPGSSSSKYLPALSSASQPARRLPIASEVVLFATNDLPRLRNHQVVAVFSQPVLREPAQHQQTLRYICHQLLRVRLQRFQSGQAEEDEVPLYQEEERLPDQVSLLPRRVLHCSDKAESNRKRKSQLK